MALGRCLRGRAHACMDISDGLLADLQHILAASQVGARVYHAKIPLSIALAPLAIEQRMNFALRGGDDYELLFTLPAKHLSTVKAAAAKLGIPITVIGEIDAYQQGLQLDYSFPDPRKGYEHFSTG
ncbi:MAG: thiamine-phosphate kinase [Thiothrix sp.]